MRVSGTVQGVGFRPYVHRLASASGLAGFVRNDAAGVLVEVEGPAGAVESFLGRLAREAPPLARIEQLAHEDIEPRAERGFVIERSPHGGVVEVPVTPDGATCRECLAELFDPADRRYRYPFVNCTNCGPRFTIVRGIPYDRPQTTMAGFTMCRRCEAEYRDPGDRRFHAQPNACPDCGPSVALLAGDGRPAPPGHDGDPVLAAARALAEGGIVAIKGIGGVHLACDATSEPAVRALRARKHREERPFALMAADADAAGRLAEVGTLERGLLESAERPIVLLPRRARAAVAASVAPGLPELGLMLPYSPLHHLLLHDLLELGCEGTLVMTSGNASDEPIAYRDEEIVERLGGIADLILTHDRPIETRTDDSVLRTVSAAGTRRVLFVRRSRGYVPAGIALPEPPEQPILACGAQLKSTFCLARGGRAIVSHHIGDLENEQTLRSFREGIEHFERLLEIEPEIVAHDLHPEYLSTKYALDLDGVELVGVQHHHAHLAACLAEHGESAAHAVGAIFDGTGYGSDGTVWGGELLAGDVGGFRRVGMLRPVRLPGGAAAIREPWRMACAWLAAAAEEVADVPVPAAVAGHVAPQRWRQVAHLARSGLSSPATSSMGRLFDAVAALCGVRAHVSYEGQAAIELEAACDPHERGRYPIDVHEDVDALVIDPRETIRCVAADAERGAAVGRIAAMFHAAVTQATVSACTLAAERERTELVVLSGGVFLNRRLLEGAAAGLSAAGLRVLFPERLPIGDGGISYGQTAVAARRVREGAMRSAVSSP